MQIGYFPLYFLKQGFLVGFLLVFLSGFTLFALNGSFIKWNLDNGDTVDFIINPAGCNCDLTEQEITDTALASMQQWSDVRGSFFQFANLEDTSPELFTQDPSLGSKEAKFDDGFNVISFSTEVPEGFSGFARFKLEDNVIVEADVFLGAGLDYNLDRLQNLITHELGHTLGLGHDHADVASIMSYGRDNEKTELGADDIIGITTIYPKPGNEPQPDLGCASLGPFNKKGGPPPFFDQAFLSLLFLILLMWGTLASAKWITKSRVLSTQDLWGGLRNAGPPQFFRGGGLGFAVLLVMVSCAEVMEEPTEGHSQETHSKLYGFLKQQGFIIDLNQVGGGNPTDGRPGMKSQTEISFYFGQREGTLLEENKVTFYCP